MEIYAISGENAALCTATWNWNRAISSIRCPVSALLRNGARSQVQRNMQALVNGLEDVIYGVCYVLDNTANCKFCIARKRQCCNVKIVQARTYIPAVLLNRFFFAIVTLIVPYWYVKILCSMYDAKQASKWCPSIARLKKER